MHTLIITPHPLQSALINGALRRQNIKSLTLTPHALSTGWCPETDALFFPHAFGHEAWEILKPFLENISPRMPFLFLGKSHKPIFKEKEFAKWGKQSIFLDDSMPIDEIPILVRDIIQKSPLYEQGKLIQIGEYSLDRNQRLLEKNSERIFLTKKEFFLLELFLQNAGSITSRDKIINYVWDKTSYVDPNTIDVHVSRLRHKLSLTKENLTIRTVPCLGYMFSP